MASSSKSKVCFFFQDISFPLANRTRLKQFIEALFKKEKKKLDSLNYIFTTDKSLLKINQDWLKHDSYTDIITFELSTPPSPLIGEIYISVERVRENSKTLGTTFKSEIHRVIFHGALHLCGHKDKTPPESKKMRALEDKYLKMFHVKQ